LERGTFVEGAILAVPRIAILYGRSGTEDQLLSSGDGGGLRPDVVTRLGDPQLALALEIFGRERPNWGSLYKVYELACSRLGLEGLCSLAGTTKQEIRRFTATANLPALAGIEARHAAKAGDAPTPMELPAAVIIFRRLLASWLSDAPDSMDGPGA
jgi:hypothetical protein